MNGPTLRELFRDDPQARVLRLAPRQDDDFGAFATSSDMSTCVDALVVDGEAFGVTDVPGLNHSGFTHFLDGAQKSREAMFHGLLPVHLAHTSAAVLERVDAHMLPPEKGAWLGDLEAYAPPLAAARLKDWIPTCTIGVAEEDTGVSIKDKIAKEIGRQREQREIELAVAFCERLASGLPPPVARSAATSSPALREREEISELSHSHRTAKQSHAKRDFLMIDGGIGRLLQRCPTADAVVGIVKTHGRQYFQSRARVEAVLAMKAGQRTSVFERPEDMLQGAKAYSFYLKLRDGEFESPLFGVVRVELPPIRESIDRADEIAAWVLHERNPLSLPDRRHDRLLYPIHLVEMQLKSRQPSDAAIAARIG